MEIILSPSDVLILREPPPPGAIISADNSRPQPIVWLLENSCDLDADWLERRQLAIMRERRPGTREGRS